MAKRVTRLIGVALIIIAYVTGVNLFFRRVQVRLNHVNWTSSCSPSLSGRQQRGIRRLKPSSSYGPLSSKRRSTAAVAALAIGFATGERAMTIALGLLCATGETVYALVGDLPHHPLYWLLFNR
jgi:hypothetical protein